jgi:hypothetical protein
MPWGPQESVLSRILRNNRFGFIPKGTYNIKQIYESVRARYPQLCDDEFLCKHCCKYGSSNPEWMHIVRLSLNHLKGPSSRVQKDPLHGYWTLK